MQRAVLSLLFVLLGLLIAVPAMAGNWGESWGSMVWGSVAAVPTMGWLGGGVLVSLLVGLSWWRRRIRHRGRWRNRGAHTFLMPPRFRSKRSSNAPLLLSSSPPSIFRNCNQAPDPASWLGFRRIKL